MLGSRILCFTRFVKLYLNCVTIITLFHYSAQFFAYWQNFYAYNIFKNILIKLTTAARGRHSLVRPDNNSYNNVWEVTERLFPPREHHSLVRRPVTTTFKRLKREIRHGEGGGGRGWGQGPRTRPPFIVAYQNPCYCSIQYTGQSLLTLLSINYLVLCI